MTIQEFINKTSHLPGDTRIDIVIGDEDSNRLDTSEFELHHLDDESTYIELFIYKPAEELL